jgi:hypothetical protein
MGFWLGANEVICMKMFLKYDGLVYNKIPLELIFMGSYDEFYYDGTFHSYICNG